jgi:hypothetical protein
LRWFAAAYSYCWHALPYPVADDGGWGSNGSGGSSSGGDPPPLINPVDAIKRELGMESNKLDPVVKDRVEAAIARLGFRVTVGQVRWQRLGQD